MSQKSRSQLKILGSRRVTWSKFRAYSCYSRAKYIYKLPLCFKSRVVTYFPQSRPATPVPSVNADIHASPHWNVLYNSLPNLDLTSHSKAIAFADDLIILTRGDTVVEAENYMNLEVRKILEWAINSKLKFNENKSKVMHKHKYASLRLYLLWLVSLSRRRRLWLLSDLLGPSSVESCKAHSIAGLREYLH